MIPFSTAGVGWYHNAVAPLHNVFLDPLQHRWLRIEIVNRNVKESLVTNNFVMSLKRHRTHTFKIFITVYIVRSNSIMFWCGNTECDYSKCKLKWYVPWVKNHLQYILHYILNWHWLIWLLYTMFHTKIMYGLREIFIDALCHVSVL